MRRVLALRLRRVVLLTAVIAGLALAGCGSNAAPSDVPEGVSTRAAADRVTLSVEPNPPRANEDARLEASVVDANGRAVEGATVKIAAQHTGMAMGSLSADATEGDRGQYTATVKPSMAGTWKVTVTVEAGGAVRNVDFDLDVQ